MGPIRQSVLCYTGLGRLAWEKHYGLLGPFLRFKIQNAFYYFRKACKKGIKMKSFKVNLKLRNVRQEPYSQPFIFFVTFECAE
jgi:hypothetical protein